MTSEYRTKMEGTGGFSVRGTERGWVVERWSTISGTMTGGRWLVYYSDAYPRGADLRARASTAAPLIVADMIDTVARFSEAYPRERVRCLAKPYAVR